MSYLLASERQSEQPEVPASCRNESSPDPLQGVLTVAARHAAAVSSLNPLSPGPASLFRMVMIVELDTLQANPLQHLSVSMGKPKGSAKKSKSKSKARSNGPPQPAPTQPLKTSVWQPGEDQMEEDETLAYDPTAYHCLVAFSAEWPCLRCLPPSVTFS